MKKCEILGMRFEFRISIIIVYKEWCLSTRLYASAYVCILWTFACMTWYNLQILFCHSVQWFFIFFFPTTVSKVLRVNKPEKEFYFTRILVLPRNEKFFLYSNSKSLICFFSFNCIAITGFRFNCFLTLEIPSHLWKVTTKRKNRNRNKNKKVKSIMCLVRLIWQWLAAT